MTNSSLEDHAKMFVRKALGFIWERRVISLDKMAKYLHEAGLSPSVESGRMLAPSLSGSFVHYDGFKYLYIAKTIDDGGNEAYRIAITDERRRTIADWCAYGGD
ncbi:MAG: hypothetical protein AABW51_02790 [Nanoarchaeota archaeon]